MCVCVCFVLARACGCVVSRVIAFGGECACVCVRVLVGEGACVSGFLCVYMCVCAAV